MTKEQFMAMSLLYKLKCQFMESEDRYCRKKVIGTISGIYDDGSIVCSDAINACPSKFKLILRPLSDLNKEIEHNGEKFVPKEGILGRHGYGYLWQIDRGGKIDPNKIQYECLKLLIEWHFDIIGLLQKGEAIDVNTLEINPYK